MTALSVAALVVAMVAAIVHPWPLGDHDGTIETRIAAPENFTRVPAAPGSFAAWLRALPLRPGRPAVMLYNGKPKRNQAAHFAVVAMDTGDKDLQQCADAVIRLRAEYLWGRNRPQDLCFRLTSGDPIPWSRWSAGEAVTVGKRVGWGSQPADSSYAGFRHWLDLVFTYAGTRSLARDLKSIDFAELRPGDVFVHGGSPGHAVLVLDVVAAPDGTRMMMLGQSYMPAQEFQVLRDPADRGTPWIPVSGTGKLVTPEWTFDWKDLKRFPENACQSDAETKR